MTKSAYGSLDEFFTGLKNYGSDTDDPWGEYKTRFLKLDRAGRANELACYDDLLENEHRPTRELGEWITKAPRAGGHRFPVTALGPMNLAQQIELAQAKNEQTLAARIAAPVLEVDPRLLNGFASFCKQRGVRCTPAVVAAFVHSQYTDGADPGTILKSLEAIEAYEVNQGWANPIATPAVRAALAEIMKIDAPRSWPKTDKLKFMTLPADIREIVARRARQDELALRRAQSELAELRKQIQPKENCSDVRQEES